MTNPSYSYERHPDAGWRCVRLSCPGSNGRETAALFTPEVGSNLLSFRVDGHDYLQATEGSGAAARILGTPILYPTPNRVRDAVFTFEGRTFRLVPNLGPNFIHGLVREIPWECGEPQAAGDSISVASSISFRPGTDHYNLFPIRNTLALSYTLSPSRVRLDFAVRNDDTQLLPFGLAIHPYFSIIGPRGSVRLQIPAQKRMEAIELLPTGRLLDLGGAFDLRRPTSLRELDLDDVYWGLQSPRPQVLYYDSLGTKVTLRASDLFSHSVVYTPQGKPYFCVENQSCSTDAHNLHARGLLREAHLTILDPGETASAWIELTVEKQ